MKDYKLGIIGGMGPEATCDFYHRIIKHTKASNDQEHIDMVILNHSSIIDRTYAIKNDLQDELIEMIYEDIKILESLNVKNIAIPCNTCHTIYEELQDLTSIPILNMVYETVKFLDRNRTSCTKVGLMATDGTILSNMYQRWFDIYNLPLYIPNNDVQTQVMDIIYNEVKSKGFYDKKHFERVLNTFLDNGCTHVILGCTELSGFKKDFEKFTIDPMDFLVRACIEKSGKTYK